MGKPTPEQLETALEYAELLRDKDQDQHFIGKSLLNLNYRIKYLEKVLYTAKEYLHSGLGGREQTDLMNAIAEAEKASRGKNEDSDDITMI